MKSKIKNILISGFIVFAMVLSLIFGVFTTSNKTYAEFDMIGNDVEIKNEFDCGTFSEHSYYHGIADEEGLIFNDESEGAYAYFEDSADTLHLYNPTENDITEITLFDTDNKFTIYFHGNGTYTIDRVNRFDSELGDIEIVTDKDVMVIINHIDTNENFTISGQGVVYCFTSVPEGGTVKVGKTYKASWSTCFDVDEFQIMIFDDEANDWSETPFAILNNSGFGYNAGTQINYNLFVSNGGLVRFKICAYLDERLILESLPFYVQWGHYYVVYNSNYGDDIDSNEYLYVYTDSISSHSLKECPFDAPNGKEFVGYKIEDSEELKQPGEIVSIENGSQIFAIWEDVTNEKVAESLIVSYNGDVVVGNNFDMSKLYIQVSYNDESVEQISANDVEFYSKNNELIADLTEISFNEVGTAQIIVKYNSLVSTMNISVVEESKSGNENDNEITDDNNDGNENNENQNENNNGTEPKTEQNENKLSGGAIAGIVIACVVVIGAGVGGSIWFVRKKKQA